MTSPKAVLWQQLQRLMTCRWGEENLTRLAKEARVGVATIARIKSVETSTGPQTTTSTTPPGAALMLTARLSVFKFIR